MTTKQEKKMKKSAITFITLLLLLIAPALIRAEEIQGFVPAVSEAPDADIGRIMVEDEESITESGINDDGKSFVIYKGADVLSGGAVSVEDLLENLPGVYLNKSSLLNMGTGTFAASNLKIRGLGGAPNSGILVIVDGIPRSMGVFKHPLFDTIQLGSAESVEIIKGPCGVLYGNQAVAGVINIKTKTIDNEGMKTSIGTMIGNHYTQSHFIETRIRKQELQIGANVNYNSTAGIRPNSDSYDENAHGSLKYDLDENWVVSAEGDYSYIREFNPGPTDAINWVREAESYRLIQRDGKISMEHKHGDLSGSLTAYTDSGSNQFLKNAKPSLTPGVYIITPGIYSMYENQGARVAEEWIALPGNSTKFGFDWDYLGAFFAAGPNHSGWHENSFSPYISSSQVAGIFTLSAGLRCYISSVWGTEFIPQAAFKISLFEGQYIYINASKGFKTPAIGTVIFEDFDGLKPEDYWQYEVGVTHNIMDNVKYGISLYQTEGTNLLRYNQALLKTENSGRILFRGIDTDLDIRILTYLHLGGTLSYLDPREKTAGQAILSGSVYYKVETGAFDAGVNCSFAKDRFDGDLRSVNVGDYAIFGADVSYKAKLFGAEEEFYLNVGNIFNRQYLVKTGYPAAGFDYKTGLTIKF